MSLACPLENCRAKPGMCLHDKIVGILVLVAAALFLVRL